MDVRNMNGDSVAIGTRTEISSGGGVKDFDQAIVNMAPVRTDSSTNGTKEVSSIGSEESFSDGDVCDNIKSVNGLKIRERVLSSSMDSLDCSWPRSKAENYRRRSASVLEVKEQAFARLQEELQKAQSELKLKDEEVEKLAKVRDQMGEELEDLTASLFEEANNMVQEANIKRMNVEKLLQESNSKIEVLEAEVEALKTLVITSTPSMPNKHLHPQLHNGKKKTENKFVKGHRRSTSHHNISEQLKTTTTEEIKVEAVTVADNREVDPVCYEEFKRWKAKPCLSKEDGFLARIIDEDIQPCLNFTNKELSQSVLECVVENSLTIEPIVEKNPFPRRRSLTVNAQRCALTETNRVCRYRIRLGDAEPWYFISALSRNRIATVCDFYTYVRYVHQGLVKSDDSEIYWEIVRLRKQMACARLGLG